MKSFYKKVLSTFQKQSTKDKFLEHHIPPVRYIDLYAQQDLNTENFDLFQGTSLLVEWDIDHTQNPPVANLTFYVCYEQLRDTSNISLNQELGLKFLDYIQLVDETLSDLESEETGKLTKVDEGFNQMDSIVDVYLLKYECSYKRKKINPQDDHLEGSYDSLRLSGNLVQKVEFDL